MKRKNESSPKRKGERRIPYNKSPTDLPPRRPSREAEEVKSASENNSGWLPPSGTWEPGQRRHKGLIVGGQWLGNNSQA
ncbi:hypothetical protein SKAU_G00273100 [Synaphobranchus kaupii]|uniref:Uncharacterized protein n=1 Tax=Synaphobranchus kaupii TaxID=118154 RepID=A0A9Q1IQS8_SYNKA|nr:hypothetical protein SKAU_G00273100 [Synaphobranchus kaupii]